ncbi:helix-turn-helix transcriptional regulator [Pseudonocardia bannensis]|uniref:WYL domain-containing protein n=1 Tax=Pseudonocardia bannensis TaxID=630973 RepID=A0A848DHY9_9PSEU|nr:WYL domain-containing protein [Pseudonocardia bannensis]NMH92165.1 WYL domain-containing protein [Pseudonocardia bannensis]
MRASRLVALLFTLQRRRAATAAELAAELEVSERTIYRDVAALQDAGVPLWAESGRGGGIRLLDGWRTRLDGLTSREAAAILAIGAPQVLADLGMSSALSTAQAKLLATLPPDFREHARVVSERFHLDAPGWFASPQQAGPLTAVAEAVWERRRLRVRYARGAHAVERTLEPLGLVLKAGVWYLVAAIAGEAGAIRTYRVARILAAELDGAYFERPPGFVLAQWWAESAARFAGSLLREKVRLRLGPGGLRALPHVTDADAAVRAVALAGPADAEGWREVTLEVESVDVAAGQLTALGGQVEALDPPTLRAALAAAGAALAARNAH